MHQTPYYSYDADLLCRTVSEALKQSAAISDAHIHYAVKANHNPGILRTMASFGLGADCVSGGEIRQALDAGIRPQDIVYSGVGKTDAEIEFALRSGIWCFNVESAQELEVIDGIAGTVGCRACVAIRVNPAIDSLTYPGISTGGVEAKFGINMDRLPQIVRLLGRLRHVSFTGLHFHIGSQILHFEDFERLCVVAGKMTEWFEENGLSVRSLNVGGGLGVDYDNPVENPIPDFKAYFGIFSRKLNLPPGVAFHCELGRSLVAQCGSLITRCIYVKEGSTKRWAIVDAGMNDLIRPALYGARHKILNISSPEGERMTYDVVGPVCESSDCFAKDYVLPQVHRGDTLAILSAGAYGESMASTYNSRPLPAGHFERKTNE